METKKVNLIDTKKIVELLEQEFIEVMSKDVNYYSNYNIILDVEQQYVKSEDRAPNNIYITIKFAQANINLTQIILPITLNVVSEKNNIEACQRLLLDFSQEYNLQNVDIQDTEREINYSITQFYSSPSNSTNFNEVYSGFRSVFFLTGTYLISQNANQFELYYIDDSDNNELKKIETISNNLSFNVVLDSQPYFNTKNFAESEAKYAVFALGITSYFTTSNNSESPNLYDKIISIISKNLEKMPDGINTNFNFRLIYKNGVSFDVKVKLHDFSQQGTIGQMPIVNITFTC